MLSYFIVALMFLIGVGALTWLGLRRVQVTDEKEASRDSDSSEKD